MRQNDRACDPALAIFGSGFYTRQHFHLLLNFHAMHTCTCSDSEGLKIVCAEISFDKVL